VNSSEPFQPADIDTAKRAYQPATLKEIKMSDDIVEELNDVIAVLKGGAIFYRDAAKQVTDPVLVELFRTNADKRDQAVADLSAHVRSHGETPSEGSWAEAAYSWYTSALGTFGDKEATLVAQLEEHEDRTLEELHDAIEDIPAGTPAHTSIMAHLKTFKDTHDQMRAMKKAA